MARVLPLTAVQITVQVGAHQVIELMLVVEVPHRATMAVAVAEVATTTQVVAVAGPGQVVHHVLTIQTGEVMAEQTHKLILMVIITTGQVVAVVVAMRVATERVVAELAVAAAVAQIMGQLVLVEGQLLILELMEDLHLVMITVADTLVPTLAAAVEELLIGVAMLAMVAMAVQE